MHYFNANGEQGEMTCMIIKNEFIIEGNKLRFVGIINDSNTLIQGSWHKPEDGKEWVEFIELQLSKE